MPVTCLGQLPEHHEAPCTILAFPALTLLPSPLIDEDTQPLEGQVTCPRPQSQQQQRLYGRFQQGH